MSQGSGSQSGQPKGAVILLPTELLSDKDRLKKQRTLSFKLPHSADGQLRAPRQYIDDQIINDYLMERTITGIRIQLLQAHQDPNYIQNAFMHVMGHAIDRSVGPKARVVFERAMQYLETLKARSTETYHQARKTRQGVTMATDTIRHRPGAIDGEAHRRKTPAADATPEMPNPDAFTPTPQMTKATSQSAAQPKTAWGMPRRKIVEKPLEKRRLNNTASKLPKTSETLKQRSKKASHRKKFQIAFMMVSWVLYARRHIKNKRLRAFLWFNMMRALAFTWRIIDINKGRKRFHQNLMHSIKAHHPTAPSQHLTLKARDFQVLFASDGKLCPQSNALLQRMAKAHIHQDAPLSQVFKVCELIFHADDNQSTVFEQSDDQTQHMILRQVSLHAFGNEGAKHDLPDHEAGASALTARFRLASNAFEKHEANARKRMSTLKTGSEAHESAKRAAQRWQRLSISTKTRAAYLANRANAKPQAPAQPSSTTANR